MKLTKQKNIAKKHKEKNDANKTMFNTLIKKASKPLQSKKKTKA
jgi:hypothetical protein